MRKKIFLLIIFLLMAMLPTQLQKVRASPRIIYVPDDFKTIQSAVYSAISGDTIMVRAGIYYENVIINQTSISLVGENRDTTIIDGQGIDNVVSFYNTSITMNGFTIRNGKSFCGIEASKFGNHKIFNNKFINNAFGVSLLVTTSGSTVVDNTLISNSLIGINAASSSNNNLSSNYISKSSFGIKLEGSNNNFIIGNTVSDTSYGIYLYSSNLNNVDKNNVSSKSVGIYSAYSNDVNIRDNTLSGCAYGIELYGVTRNNVLRNTASDNSYGIYLVRSNTANVIDSNLVSNNDWGIQFYDSDSNTVTFNTASYNSYGIYFVTTSTGNSIYKNNFLENVMQAFQHGDSPNTWSTRISGKNYGNYWNDYLGEDTDGDGVGDYPPESLPHWSVDNYPLMNPTTVVHDVAIVSVETSATTVYEGQVVNITVTARNEGTVSETFTVTAKYVNRIIGTRTVTSLTRCSSTTLLFNWDTTAVPTGFDYQINAEASTVAGETDTVDNVFVDGTITVEKPPIQTTLSLIPASIIGPPPNIGETFVVNVTVSTVSNLWSWQAGITFNPNVLEAVSFAEGPFLATGGTTLWQPATINNTLGIIAPHKCTLTSGSTPVSGSGTLAFITFRVKGYGSSTLHLGPDPPAQNVVLNDPTGTPIPATLKDGYFKLPWPPVASFTFSPLTPYTKETVTFNATASYDPDGSIVKYQWNFGDGTNATGKIATHSFTDNGTYRVTLTVTDSDGLTNVKSADIVVRNRPPVAIFTESAETVPTGQLIYFNASGSYDLDGTIISYFWNFGDGTNALGVIVSHPYADNALYNVTLTVTDNDGAKASVSATKTILNRAPVASFTESATTVFTREVITFNASSSYDPDGTIVSYFWTFGDGTNATGIIVTHAYAEDGVFTVTLKVTDNDGATAVASATKTVKNRPPVAFFTESATTVLTGVVITFNASASYDPDGFIASYFWTFGDGTSATGVTVTHAYADNGIYTVTLTVTDNDGAIATATATKTVTNRPPIASFTESATTVLTGVVITFNASASYDPDGFIASYFWTFGDGTSATGVTVTHAYADNGTYTVMLTVTDDDGATSSASATKTVLNRPPVARFTESATTVYTGEVIYFNASSSYDPDGTIVSYSWTFGDGANATGVIVSHAYVENGTYVVTLTVKDNDGATASTSSTKTVLNRPPVAVFTESAESVYTGETITFNASSSYDPDGSIVSYFWNFGDGANATGVIVSHAYADNGVYTVTLTVTDNDGAKTSASAKKTVWNRAPIASFTESATTVFTNEVISFNASGSYDPDGWIVSYFWNFGDGTNATGVTTSHAYAENGVYTVTLTVTDNDGAKASTTSTKQILNRAPIASFTESATTVLTGQVIYFNASASYDPDGSIVSYLWAFGDGATATGVTASHAYSNDGTYIVTLKVTDNDGATATATSTKTVLNRPPVASFTESATVVLTLENITFNASSSYDPDGSIVSYFWTFGDGTNALGKIVSHAYSDNGSYTVTLKVTDDDGATATVTATKTVLNRPPVASFTESATTVYTGQIIFFNASASSDLDGFIVSYLWAFGDGATATGVTVSHAYVDNGTYTVTLTVKDNDGASTSVSAVKTVLNRPPVANFTYSPPNPFPNEPATFNASNSYDPDGYIVKYFWNFGDGTNATGKVVTHAYANAGTYSVTLTVTDNDGATGATTVIVTVSYYLRDVAVVNVAPSATEAYPTWVVPINVTVIVKNQGERTETFTVTAYYNTTVIGTQTVTLAQGANATLLFSWNLLGVAPGTYTIRAEASVLLGETDIADNSLIDGTIKLKHPGDANDDAIVNVYDLNILAKALGTSVGDPNYDRRADFNGDGKIDDYDIEILQLYWGP